jgi:hypothetical protein
MLFLRQSDGRRLSLRTQSERRIQSLSAASRFWQDEDMCEESRDTAFRCSARRPSHASSTERCSPSRAHRQPNFSMEF